ncbi:MAG: beta-ketoacyl-ACP synthase [Caulobacter sp.]|jgi:3-oxoacyl-[acyl-carrier-protein] synthase II
MRRVVVTGMAGITSMGRDWSEISGRMRAGETGIRYMPEWERLTDMGIKVAGGADWFEHEGHFPRQAMRSMGRVSVMSVDAADRALQMAGLKDDPILRTGRVGVAAGSSYGSTPPTIDFANFVQTGKAGKLNATSYIRMMSHTAPVNVSVYFGLKGRVITTSSACVSGSQGIGYSAETIQAGKADIMLAGGAEELCPTMAMVFDRLYATSKINDSTASRPFDASRDGLVTGEGAAFLVLEEREHALARGATILAEIKGFATNADGAHISHPDGDVQAVVMRQALEDAGIQPSDLAFINGHGTATVAGDTSEAQATHEVYGGEIPFHTLKGHFGHTLGACGAIEAWLGIEMLTEGWAAPIANFRERDSRCAPLDFIDGDGRKIGGDFFASNNFAFGGINTSLIIGRA